MVEKRSIILNLRESICKIICPVRSLQKYSVGTGFFIREDGTLITCCHIIGKPLFDQNGLLQWEYYPNIFVETTKKTVPAKVIHDVNSTRPLTEDYAILKAEINGVQGLTLGDYDYVEPGDDILILGFPFGFKHLCATFGMISGKYRSPSHINKIVTLDKLMVDASINPGNSGGPLIDIKNETVVGVVAVRLGNIEEKIERLEKLGAPRELIEVLEATNKFLNVGLGEAISIRYAYEELERLGVK